MDQHSLHAAMTTGAGATPRDAEGQVQGADFHFLLHSSGHSRPPHETAAEAFHPRGSRVPLMQQLQRFGSPMWWHDHPSPPQDTPILYAQLLSAALVGM